MKKVYYLPILLASCLTVLSLSTTAFSGGHMEPIEPPHLADELGFIAWYEQQLVHVALANRSNTAHELTVSMGTQDVGTHIYGSHKFTLPGNAIRILEFPLLRKKTARGDLKTADMVFVYAHDAATSEHVGEDTIQNAGQDHPSAYLKNYVVNAQSEARINYHVEASNNLDIVLIPKNASLDKLQMSGKVKSGLGHRLLTEDLENLDIPDLYRQEIRKLMKDHFCFAVEPGADTTILVDYSVPAIDNFKTVNLPAYTYTFTPSGGLLSGGKTSSFFIYNSRWTTPETVEGDFKIHSNRLDDPKAD